MHQLLLANKVAMNKPGIQTPFDSSQELVSASLYRDDREVNNSKTIRLMTFPESNTGENKCLDKTIDVAVYVLINRGVEQCEQLDT